METMDDVRNLPQNIVRKMGGLRHCMFELDNFRMKYQPIFEDDPFIVGVLEQMQTEYDWLQQALQEYPDYNQYVSAYWKES